MPFHPTGNSQKLTLSSAVAQTIELAGLPSEGRVIRIVPLNLPSKGNMFVALGDADTMVSNSTGMPVETVAMKEQFISVAGETHAALLMQGAGNYEVSVTPGEII